MRRSSRRLILTAAVSVAVLAPAGIPASAAPAPVAISGAQATTAAPARRTPQARAFLRAVRQRIVDTALSRIGSSYVWGGSGPEEFDCSGLVMWTYLTSVKVALPHYSGAQMDVARPVTGKLRKGDLLFYGPDGSQHVALYIGAGQMVGANNPRTGIVVDEIDSSYWSQRYVGAGRIIG